MQAMENCVVIQEDAQVTEAEKQRSGSKESWDLTAPIQTHPHA